MSETLTSQQLLHNSYHLAIRSSLLAIQSTLSLQQTMLRSDDSTFADIKSALASQNANLQRFTKIIAETFSKISSYKPLQSRSATSAATPAGLPHPIAPTTTTGAGIISAATLTSTTATLSITSRISAPLLTPSCYLASPTPSHATAAGSTTAAPPTPFPNAAATFTITYSPSNHTRPDLATNQFDKVLLLGVGEFTTLPCLPSSPNKPALSSTTSTISQSHLTITSPPPPLVMSPTPPLVISPLPALNSTWPIEQKRIDARNLFVEMNNPTESSLQLERYEISSCTLFYVHLQSIIWKGCKLYDKMVGNYELKLFYLMPGRNEMKIFGKNVFIFDPGGCITNRSNAFDVWLKYGDLQLDDDEFEKKITVGLQEKGCANKAFDEMHYRLLPVVILFQVMLNERNDAAQIIFAATHVIVLKEANSSQPQKFILGYLLHNSASTTPMSLLLAYDLEDKVDFKGSVMIRILIYQYQTMHHMVQVLQEILKRQGAASLIWSKVQQKLHQLISLSFTWFVTNKWSIMVC